MQQLILNPDGEFYVNTARFVFVDPTTNVRFEPNVQIKTKATPWMLGQPTIQKVAAEKPPELVKVPLPTKATK